LFAWFVRRTGAADIWEGLRDVGWGLGVIVAIAGLRFAVRAISWPLCLEPPHHIGFREAFAAVIVGDAIGNLTPLGLIASEPAKAAFVRQRVPLGAGLTALAIENLLYTFSVAAMIAASTIALLYSFNVPAALRTVGWVATIAIALLFTLAAWMIWRRPAVVSRIVSAFAPRGSDLHSRVARLHEIEEQIYSFVVRRRSVLPSLALIYVAFHALGVLEIYATWWLITGTPPPLVTAFVLEGANRLVTVVFKFVPLRLGVDEWTTGSFTEMLGYGAAVGGTLAIVRKLRVLVWVLAGTVLLVRRGLGSATVHRSEL
jgi:hypothetical protein